MYLPVFLLILSLNLVWSLPCDRSLQINLEDDFNWKPLFWNFLSRESPLNTPDPFLTGYFAYETRKLMSTTISEHKKPSLIYCSSGKFYAEGNFSNEKSTLVKIVDTWNEITRQVLYSPQQYTGLSNWTTDHVLTLIEHYNIDCVIGDMDCNSVQLINDLAGRIPLGKGVEVSLTLPVEEVCNLEFALVKCIDRTRVLIIKSQLTPINTNQRNVYELFINWVKRIFG